MTDLDPEGRRTLMSLLASMKAAGTTLIVAEHDPEDAAAGRSRLCAGSRRSGLGGPASCPI